jgi:hypothetical protein
VSYKRTIDDKIGKKEANRGSRSFKGEYISYEEKLDEVDGGLARIERGIC